MSLISSVVAFAKADTQKKGIPVLITLLQNLQSAQTGIQRTAALLKFEGDAMQGGAQIGQDIITDLNTTAQAELQADLAKVPPAQPTS